MKVYVVNNSTGNQEAVNVEQGATVSDAVRAAGIAVDGNITVRKNRQDCTLGEAVYDGDKISVTRKDLKGAAGEPDAAVDAAANAAAIQITYQDILSAGTGPAKVGSAIVAQAMAEHAKKSNAALLGVVTSLLDEARSEAPCVNRRVADAEKALAAAKDDQARFGYALNELNTNGNIFSMLGFLGRKDQAAAICNKIGCKMPADKDALWHTSADGK